MEDKDEIDEEEIAKVEKMGGCLGKYRILIGSTYYCYLMDIYNCTYQNRKYIKAINSEMSVCMSNKQNPCEECDRYKISTSFQVELKSVKSRTVS